MLRHPREREGDRSRTGTLEVFDIQVFDEGSPSVAAPAPLACRWHLRHHWSLVRVDARTTYVACDACGRLPTRTIFEPPLP